MGHLHDINEAKNKMMEKEEEVLQVPEQRLMLQPGEENTLEQMDIPEELRPMLEWRKRVRRKE